MRPPKAAVLVAIVTALTLVPGLARAQSEKRVGSDEGGGTPPQSIMGIHAAHWNGQTFLNWEPAGGSMWQFYVYRLNRPIVTEQDLQAATLVAILGDSTATNKRLSQITGVLHPFVVDVNTELRPQDGLYVHTPATAGLMYYAVTSQAIGMPENRTLFPNGNTMVEPIEENVTPPQPIYQRDVFVSGRRVSVYTLFASNTDTPLFPAMANRPGMAFNCGIEQTPGTGLGLLLIKPHQRLGNFLDAAVGTGTPGENVLSLDDPLPNGENSFWFGYHPGYDVRRTNNGTPTSGVVVDYTFRRVKYTIEWAMQEFPVDPGRVYAFGYSMGGIGSLQLALWMPDRIAAVMSVMGKFDFSFLEEPVYSWFNPGHPMRATVDQMWGHVSTDLKLPDGQPVYERMNLGRLVARAGVRGVPPVVAFNGKRDNVVGWAEKLPFYEAMQLHRHGGSFYWDNSDHYGLTIRRYWQPMVNLAYLYRFRSDRSYPAFTNCSLDATPGNGVFASGDTIGTINGFMDWDTTVVDLPDMWQAKLSMRTLFADGGITIRPPSECLTDVTANRLQRFTVPVGSQVPFTVRRLPDMALLQSGLAPVDELGRPTAVGVRVLSTGVVITFGRQPDLTLDVGGPSPGARLRLGLSANPVRGPLRMSASWPAGVSGRVVLMDVAGRLVQSLYEGPRPPAGELTLETGRLAPGLYLVRASAGGEQTSQRVVVLR